MEDNSSCEDGQLNPPASATPPSIQNHPPSSSKFSSGSHIRSRITVVCAECKRLKLKCDRRTPCGSCVKRDTVHRCLYSAAAAEKIDVQSLHNRLQLVESQVAQIAAGGLRVATSAASPSSHLPFPHNDHTMLATGKSGSSISISLDDVTALWLDHVDLDQALSPNTTIQPGSSQMRLEPTAVAHDEVSPAAHLPPLNSYYNAWNDPPCLTPALVALLPSAPSTRSRITTALEETMRMHPCINVRNFRSRIDMMFNWAKEEESRPTSTAAASGSTNAKADLARSIFFNVDQHTPKPVPTLSFFASVAAAYALGVLACKENEAVSEAEMSKSSRSTRTEDSRTPVVSARSSAWQKCSAHGLYALSCQALSVFETAQTYDLDYLVTTILQVLFLMHDGKPRVSHLVYPLVGKMVSISYMMGLSTDPSEYPGKYSVFDAEMRRRIWWDVYFYDVFVSDCMGQAPIIQDNTYTTKMPADVDEEQFGPSSSSLPVPVPRGAGGDPSEVGFAYFVQKCRLAQLVKNVKKRRFKDPLEEDSLVEDALHQAEQFEHEIKRWLSDLPRAYRLQTDADSSASSLGPLSSRPIAVSPNLQAQRCELAVLANRLVLKLFLPFLKMDMPADITPRRIATSVIDASHAIIQAIQVLHQTWRQMRPAAFAFYSFGRTLFDAAVMAACAVISHPTGASSTVALADLNIALNIMKDPKVATGASRDNQVGGVSEAVKIIELLRAKADGARQGNPVHLMAQVFHAGTKRKRSDAEQRPSGEFHLPYAGAGATCSTPAADVPSSLDSRLSMGSESTSYTPRSRPKYEVIPQSPVGRAEQVSTPLLMSLEVQEDMKPQIPIRGRPRQDSMMTGRRREANSGVNDERMPAPPHPPQPHSIVPSQTPESLRYSTPQDVPMGDAQSRIEFSTPFSTSPVEDVRPSAHAMPPRRYSRADSVIAASPTQQQGARTHTPSATMHAPIAAYANAEIPQMRGSTSTGSVYDSLGMTVASPQSTPSFASAALPTHSTLPYDTDFYAIPAFGPPNGPPSSVYERSVGSMPMIGLGISDSRPGTASTPVTSLTDSPSYAMNGGGMSVSYNAHPVKVPNNMDNSPTSFQEAQSMQSWPTENVTPSGSGQSWNGYY